MNAKHVLLMQINTYVKFNMNLFLLLKQMSEANRLISFTVMVDNTDLS